jgi:ketosteroid isomerase-like protein
MADSTLTSTLTSNDVAARDAELNDLIRAGRALEGLERLYAEDVVMQENLAPPTVGKAANRERERTFYGSVDRVNEVTLHSTGWAGATTFSEWTFDLVLKDGTPVRLDEVAVRRWRDGRIAHERFYYHL